MTDQRIICGSATEEVGKFADGYFDCLVTSPPYWALRKYDAPPQVFGGDPDCEHEWGDEIHRGRTGWEATPEGQKQFKAATTAAYQSDSSFCQKCGAWRGQLGLEPHPSLYLEHLWSIFDAIKPKMKETACVFVNMGDTYGGTRWSNAPGTGAWASPRITEGNIVHGREIDGSNWLKAKNLLMIPERFAIGMVDRGWTSRNKIIWEKKNPMPSSVKDRFSCTWEYLYFFTKSARYAFDLDAVREEYADASKERFNYSLDVQDSGFPKDARTGSSYQKCRNGDLMGEHFQHPLGKNPGDCWTISTFPFPEAHFATYPPELIRKPIRAGCPPKVCVECGKPWVRIREYIGNAPSGAGTPCLKRPDTPGSIVSPTSTFRTTEIKQYKTIGWQPTCTCDADTEPGIVLDPFVGSGTTLVVCVEKERRGVGIDISEKYCEMARRRVHEAQRKHQPRLIGYEH